RNHKHAITLRFCAGGALITRPLELAQLFQRKSASCFRVVCRVRQERPRAIQRLGCNLLCHNVTHAAARLTGFLLQLAKHSAAGVGQPLHLAHGSRIHVIDGFFRSALRHRLIRAPIDSEFGCVRFA
ncbi:MAG: hypothetical protein ACK55I_09070, partial [bacterium]